MNYVIEEYKEVRLNDSFVNYGEESLNELTYKIIGSAMEVYNNLGRGFLETVYKDCLSIEFSNRNITFQKEKKFEVIYKGIKIPHHYYADFVIENQVILEVKAQSQFVEQNLKQTINYLAVSNCKIGLLINFGENTLKYKRVILTK